MNLSLSVRGNGNLTPEKKEFCILRILVHLRCSVTSDSFVAPWTVASQVPLSTGFPRQEYWSGLPFPSPGDLSDPGCLFNLYAEYIMRNTGLDETQAGIKIAGRNIDNLRCADDTTLMAEHEEELKSLLLKVKEESEKFGLRCNIKKTNITASGPIISWQIDGETVKTVTDCVLGGPKITADGDYSHEIKRCLLLGRKVMTNLDRY